MRPTRWSGTRDRVGSATAQCARVARSGARTIGLLDAATLFGSLDRSLG
ncbi:MAG: hypothetical protein WDN30_15775 [Pararobbsia sp.]